MGEISIQLDEWRKLLHPRNKLREHRWIENVRHVSRLITLTSSQKQNRGLNCQLSLLSFQRRHLATEMSLGLLFLSQLVVQLIELYFNSSSPSVIDAGSLLVLQIPNIVFQAFDTVFRLRNSCHHIIELLLERIGGEKRWRGRLTRGRRRRGGGGRG